MKRKSRKTDAPVPACATLAKVKLPAVGQELKRTPAGDQSLAPYQPPFPVFRGWSAMAVSNASQQAADGKQGLRASHSSGKGPVDGIRSAGQQLSESSSLSPMVNDVRLWELCWHGMIRQPEARKEYSGRGLAELSLGLHHLWNRLGLLRRPSGPKAGYETASDWTGTIWGWPQN